MTLEYEINEAARERAENIASERLLETARKMLNRGFSPELVADCTGLSLEQVNRLRESL
jgi:hypothetical protein